MDELYQKPRGLATVNFFLTGEIVRTIVVYCQTERNLYNGTYSKATGMHTAPA